MIVGRENEQKILNDAYKDNSSHFIAVYGRRRVGKTYLIRESFADRFTFEHSGIFGGNNKKQLQAFELSLIDAGRTPERKIECWLDAFFELRQLIKNSNDKRKVIFIDELSWMDTGRTDFMNALENFWNGFASGKKDIVLIVCASATSWMLSKVIHNKGGLYNRLTEQINLKVFTLKECEEYIQYNGLAFNRDQILQCYMIFGGVPFYWSLLKKGLSLSQNIDEIFFSDNAPLKDEYKYLYASIFKKPELYMEIIEALGTKKSGLTRNEIAKIIKKSNNGELGNKLEELESCGFVREYSCFDTKKKGSIYQLIDNFTLYYFCFLKDKSDDPHFWTNQINTPVVNTWLGLAYERVCLLHVDKIKEKLGISGVLTNVYSYRCEKDLEKGVFGSQIDLMIVRGDHVINLCEVKYSSSEYTPDEKFDNDMRRKINDLIRATKTKYAIYPTLLTTYGLINNAYANIIQSTIRLNDLF